MAICYLFNRIFKGFKGFYEHVSLLTTVELLCYQNLALTSNDFQASKSQF